MQDLTKGNIYKTFLLFALPMVLSGILSQCYSVVNTVIAGKLLGEGALGAIGAISPLETFINSLFFGYGNGVGIYIAFLFGAKKYQRMKQVIISNALFLTGVLLLLSALLLFFRQSIYAFFRVDIAILADCDRYFVIHTAGKAIQLFAINCIYIVNAMGDGRFPFFMSVTSTVLNILISVLSITVFGLGVEGIALANIVASAVVSLLYICKLRRNLQKIGAVGGGTVFSLRAIRETSRYSLFIMLQQSVIYFAGLMLSPTINALGSAASASYTVTLRIYDVNATIYQNSAKTLGNYTAQCYGAKRYELLRKGLWVGFAQNMLFVLPILLVSIVCAQSVAMIFYPVDALQTSVDYTVAFLRYCMPFLICNIVANLFHHFFRGIGRMMPLLIATAIGSLARIVISSLLIVPFGIYGYYAGWVLSWVFDGLAGILFYRFGKWRRILK